MRRRSIPALAPMYATIIFVIAFLVAGLFLFRTAPPETPWRVILSPILVTVLLVLWTIAVSPKTSFGDSWAIWPVVFMLPAVLVWHIVVIVVLRGSRRWAGTVAVFHLAIFSLLWLGSLMLISKSSL